MAMLPFVVGSAFPPSLDQLRQSHRVKQVHAGTKLPGPIALAHLYAKYGKQAPPAIIQAASAASQQLAAATLAARATKSSTKLTTSSTLQTSTTTKITLTTSASIQSASVQATDLPNDKAYYVNVTVGSTQMLLNFDTGSSDLWVFSTLQPAAQRGSHKLYTPAGTSSGTFSVSYGEGSSTLDYSIRPTTH